ncbi:hypothetical protein RND81_01G022900 [Saponaria officinalis]|uniref:Retrotransposon Copia-like N-terminal domain-containing protein n=1 Tax=Saponaria officinalis TaxID=3572 RepID=A0AAW1N5A0_SAPOF
MQHVSTVFNGRNYLPWSRGMMLALGSKNKQGFLDGTNAKPSANSPKLQQWIRCDNMVRCWLLNSIASGIKKGFMSAKSAKLLWSEIKERYWDDIKDLEEIPDWSCGVMAGCTCNILKKIVEAASKEKVLTFLMGLSDDYENLRTNILSMEPMPGINKVYSMVQQIESQKLITNVLNSGQESSALVANRQGDTSYSWNNWKKDNREFKRPRMDDRFCHHCNKKWHTKDMCFKLHPELLHKMQQQRSKLNSGGNRFANQAQLQL